MDFVHAVPKALFLLELPMANVQFGGLDKTVETLAERDLIVKKPDGLQVQVNDTTGDLDAEGAPAVYRWVKTLDKWVLAWKAVKNSISFVNDSGIIANDQVTATVAPENGVVWDIFVTTLDGSEILAEVDVNVNDKTLTLSPDVPGEFDGKRLAFKYASGSVEAGSSGGVGSQVIGNLNDLSTTSKVNLVAAINEVGAKAGEIGNLLNLSTAEKSSLVGALNEIVFGTNSNTTSITKVSNETAINSNSAARAMVSSDAGFQACYEGSVIDGYALKAGDSFLSYRASDRGTFYVLPAGGGAPVPTGTLNVGLTFVTVNLGHDTLAGVYLFRKTSTGVITYSRLSLSDSINLSYRNGNESKTVEAKLAEIGVLTNLSTINQASLVDAVNEVQVNVGSIETVTATHTGEIATIQTQLGDIDAALSVILGV